MVPAEIVLPITEPETEWVRGRPLRKMSPNRNHARLQLKFATALDVWAGNCGEVGTEWRFRIAIPGEARRPLVPDIAFVDAARLRGLSDEALQSPELTPTVAVEILSPNDDPRDVASKIEVYLLGGSALVIVIDSASRAVMLHDGASSARLTSTDTLRHSALPEFELPLGAYFAEALDRL